MPEPSQFSPTVQCVDKRVSDADHA
jgi:hypothetical protein